MWCSSGSMPRRCTLGCRNPPFPRRLDARVIDRIRRAGARAILFDLDTAAPTDVADDNALGEAIYAAGNVVLVTTAPREGANVKQVRALRATIASSFLPTHGGVARQVEYQKFGLPSAAVAVARRAGRPVDRSGFSGDGAWIDFAGPAGTVPVTPFVNVLRGKVPASRFANKVVVIGATDPLLKDVHPVGFGSGNMRGP